MMKKLVVLVALVAAPSALAASHASAVSIFARPTVVTYGFSTRLLGAVSPPASADVTIAAKACLNASPGAALAPLTVTSDSLGHWQARVAPGVRTLYQATSGDAQSRLLQVNVRPRVRLARLAHHRFRVRVWAAQSFAGKKGFLQRDTSHGWKTVKTVPLVQTGANGRTIISGRTFRAVLPGGRTLRFLMTQAEVGNCYLPGWSKSIRS